MRAPAKLSGGWAADVYNLKYNVLRLSRTCQRAKRRRLPIKFPRSGRLLFICSPASHPHKSQHEAIEPEQVSELILLHEQRGTTLA